MGGKGSLKEKASATLMSLSLNTGVFATDTLVIDTSLAEGIFFLKVKPLKNNLKIELDGLILQIQQLHKTLYSFLLIYLTTYLHK